MSTAPGYYSFLSSPFPLPHLSGSILYLYVFLPFYTGGKKTISNPTRAAPLCETGLYRITQWPSVSSISEQEAWFHSSYTWVALCCVCSLHLLYPLIIHGWASPYMGLYRNLGLVLLIVSLLVFLLDPVWVLPLIFCRVSTSVHTGCSNSHPCPLQGNL